MHWNVDAKLVEKMEDDNKTKLAQLDEAIKDAEGNIFDSVPTLQICTPSSIVVQFFSHICSRRKILYIQFHELSL